MAATRATAPPLPSGDDNEFNIGVNVPMGAVALSAGFADSKTKVKGAGAGRL